MMNKYFLYHRFLITILLSYILVACQSTPEVSKKFNPYDFAKEQKELISDTADLGPKVNSKSDELVKTNRRVFIDENIVTDYTKIIDKNFTSTFPISVNFDNVDIRTVMETFSIVTGKNILVGDEVQGSVKARIFNEDWDDVLEAILEIKNIALTLNKDTNIVRVHTKEVISAQEEYKIKRKAEVRKTMDLNKSLEPVRSEIFRLFYSDPNTVKTQVEEIIANMEAQVAAGEGSGGSSNTSSENVKITVDARLNALIVLGSLEDLDFIEALVDEIDVPTRQILIEAFIVTVTDKFEEQFGSRLSMYYGPDRINPEGDRLIQVGGTGATTTGTTAITEMNEIGKAAKGTLADNTISSATGSLGMILDATSIDLNLELQALETENISKIIANPKVFTLDNQTATITQGIQIPYQSTSSAGTTTELKPASLTLTVTPSIVGDGNIILDLSVNNDSVTDSSVSNPPINSTSVTTKLLVADEAIVVIGGIYNETVVDTKSRTPLLADVPVVGNLFKSKTEKDQTERVFIFIAPKIL